MSLSLGLGLALTRNKGGFSLARFMAAQSDGFWFDFTKTDRLFQDSTGLIASAAANDVIGLASDQRLWAGQTLTQVLAQQPEAYPYNGAPASWPASATVNGITATRLGTGTDADGSYAEYRAQGTSTATWCDFGAFLGGNSKTASSPGKMWRSRVRVKKVGGTTANIASLTQIIVEETSGNAYITQTGGNNIALDGSLGVGQVFRQLGSTTAYVRATLYLSVTSGAAIDITLRVYDDISLKPVPGQHGVQTTNSLRPKYQTGGAQFDGSDDNLFTPYFAGSGANFVVAKVTVPASITATQIIAGVSDAGGTNPFRLAINTSGFVRGAVGSDLTIDGSVDLRGSTVVVGITCDGSEVIVFAGNAVATSKAQSGSPTTSQPWRIGSQNSDGNAANFFAGTVRGIAAGREKLTLSTFNRIAAAL